MTVSAVTWSWPINMLLLRQSASVAVKFPKYFTFFPFLIQPVMGASVDTVSPDPYIAIDISRPAITPIARSITEQGQM